MVQLWQKNVLMQLHPWKVKHFELNDKRKTYVIVPQKEGLVFNETTKYPKLFYQSSEIEQCSSDELAVSQQETIRWNISHCKDKPCLRKELKWNLPHGWKTACPRVFLFNKIHFVSVVYRKDFQRSKNISQWIRILSLQVENLRSQLIKARRRFLSYTSITNLVKRITFKTINKLCLNVWNATKNEDPFYTVCCLKNFRLKSDTM